ncbi:MAG: hypothetical protein E7337_13290 [Clostridiales bacterium]|nr:hypothetical protein [Clostridiales bacterium]
MRLSAELVASWLAKTYPVRPIAFPESTLWLDLPSFFDKGLLAPHGLYVTSRTPAEVAPEAGACIVDCSGAPQAGPIPVGCFIALAESVDERAVINCIMTCFRHYGAWLERLQRAAAAKPLEAVANICSEMSDNLFLITNADCQPLAASTAGQRETAESIERRYALRPVVTPEEMLHLRGSFDPYRDKPLPYEAESVATVDGQRLPLLAQNLSTDQGERIGYMLFLATGHELGPCDAHLLLMAAPFVEQAMSVRGHAPSSGMEFLMHTAALMLGGHRIPAEMAVQAETAAGFNGVRKRCYAVYMPTDAEGEFVRFCSRRLNAMYERCLAVPHVEALVVVVEAGPGRPEEAADVQTMEMFLDEMKLYAGASDTFDHIADLLAYHEEARMAGRFVYEVPKGTRVHFFADYRLPYLLSACASSAPKATFMPAGLARVMAYNGTANADYVETLRVYFEEGGNTAACARRLGISRNTLLPRLDRLRFLLGSDLKDPEERFLLELCLRLTDATGNSAAGVEAT